MLGGACRGTRHHVEGGIPVALWHHQPFGAGGVKGSDGLAIVVRVLNAVKHGEEARRVAFNQLI